MKRSISFFIMLFALIGIQFSVLSEVSFAKQYQLRWYTHDSPQSYRVKLGYNVFSERMKKETDGRLIIKVDAMSPITNPRDAHDAVAAGIVDMAACISGVSPGRYPILDSQVLPAMGYRSAEMASVGVNELVTRYPQVEKRMGNVKLIGLMATAMDTIGTSQKPIRKYEDFKGLKLRSSGKYAQMLLKNMGAIPIMMGPGDIYTNIQKGVIDGYNLPMGGMGIFKLHEVVDYVLLTHNWTGSFFIVMNLDVWNSLPKDIQDTINKASFSEEWIRHMGRVTDENQLEGRKLAEDAGVEIVTPSAEFKAKMEKTAKEIWKDYVRDANKRGLPGQEIVDFHLNFIKNYKD